MERIVYRKTLDVHKNGIQFTLQGFETNDNMARSIEISLMSSGDTIDLPMEQITALMYVTTPNDSEPSINKCTIKDNKIIYDVLPIVAEGITEMQIKLIETSLEGAKSVLATPRFAVEVTKGNIDDSGAIQSTTFTALEDAIARANGVYESRLVRIEVDENATFRAYYADGTTYESKTLNKSMVLLAQSYAKGQSGVRAGEDTDNSMYYSNVSKSASIQAEDSREETEKLLAEVRKHGVYTSFSIDFETGEITYISPQYKFDVNEKTGELVVMGKSYSPDGVVEGKTVVNTSFDIDYRIQGNVCYLYGSGKVYNSYGGIYLYFERYDEETGNFTAPAHELPSLLMVTVKQGDDIATVYCEGSGIGYAYEIKNLPFELDPSNHSNVEIFINQTFITS